MSDAMDVSADSPVADAAPELTTESIVEALLFSTDEPLPASKIVQILGVGDASEVKRYIEKLNERYEHYGASFRIEAIAKGYQMLTQPVFRSGFALGKTGVFNLVNACLHLCRNLTRKGWPRKHEPCHPGGSC